MTVLVPQRHIFKPRLSVPRLNFRRLGDPSFNRLGVQGQPWGCGLFSKAVAPVGETGDIIVVDGESAGSTPWEFDTITEEGTTTVTLDAAAKNNGNNGYKILADGSSDDTRGNLAAAFAEQNNDFYVRQYVFLPTGLTGLGGFQYISTMALYDGASKVCTIGWRVNGSNDPANWFINVGVGGSGQGSTNFSLNAWHYLEIHFVQHATLGGVELFADGATIKSDLTYDTSLVKPDNLYIGCHNIESGFTAADFYYIDDVIANTTGPIGAYSV